MRCVALEVFSPEARVELGKERGGCVWRREMATSCTPRNSGFAKPGARRRLFSIPRTRNEMRWGWCSRLGQQLAPILPKCAVARGKIGTALGQAAVGDLLKVDWPVPEHHLAVGPFRRSHWVDWVQVRSGGDGEFPIRARVRARSQREGGRGQARTGRAQRFSRNHGCGRAKTGVATMGFANRAWGSVRRGAFPLDQDGWTRSVGQMYL